MALLYTCYADQPVIDALVAPFSASVPGYFSWFLGTATENSKVPDFVLAQKGISAIPAGWETAAKRLILTDLRTKIRKAPDTGFPAASRVCPLGTGASGRRTAR